MIKDSQYYLSRFYTEADYRELFFSDREKFYFIEGISDEKLKMFLDQLKEEQIIFFAKGLLSKRLHAVKNLMPTSAQLLKGTLETEFNSFSNNFSPTGIHKHHIDALAFVDFLLRLSAFKDPLLRSVLIFERDTIDNFLYPKKWKLKKYYFDPFLMKNQNLDIRKKVTLILWRKGVMRKLF